jgi:long-chain acyl-CoA synthetase
MFQETVAKYGDRPAVGFRKNKGSEIEFRTYTEVDGQVRDLRRAMDAIGLKSGDRIAILAENRVEWLLVDLAAQSLGIITVAPYSSLPAAQVGYIVRDCGAKALFCSDNKQVKKAREFYADCPDLAHHVAMDSDFDASAPNAPILLDALRERGKQDGRPESDLDKLSAAVDPDQTALFIYTSGTTGEPKGAMLSHMNMLQTPDAVVDEPIAAIGPQDQFLSFLPLSHITERVGGYYLPIRVGACIIFSLGLSQIGQEMTESVRPTCMLCVPRIFENLHSRFLDSVGKMEAKQRGRIEWGLKAGTRAAQARSNGNRPGPTLALQAMIAEKLILCKIREKVTGGRIRFFVSGGAPLDIETATFFLAIGIDILEGYGLSETNIIAINRPGRQRIGTVGTLLPNVDLHLADDGEILMRGQGRMQGYFDRPEDTAEAIDADGWFHTGDIGQLSSDGYLKITDRKKDIIVLTNGKKVAPQPIEAMLKQSPYIGEAVLLGEKQSTVMALLVPAFVKLVEWAKEKGLPHSDVSQLVNSAEVQKLLKAEIDRLTASLADYEKIKRFRVIDSAFSIESGELTPTLKVKRKFVVEKYAEIISGMSRS